MSLHVRPRPAGYRSAPSGPGEEAIIQEARRLRRRRWMIRTAGVALGALTALAVVVVVDRSGGGRPASPATGRDGRPYVNLRAFAGQGTLVFVSGQQLWVIDGADQSVREVATPDGSIPSTPVISPDGAWIAYLVKPAAAAASAPAALWMARADGSDRHQVTAEPIDTAFGWSPTADLFGVVIDTAMSYPSGAHGLAPTTVDLFTPTGSPRQLTAASSPGHSRRVEDAVWSPDGRSVAVSSWDLAVGPATVETYPIDGGAPTTWFSINPGASLPGVCTGCGGGKTIADLSGWWPRWGIGFWVYSSGATRNLDSTPLEVLSAPGATPHIIAHTLSDGITDALSTRANGSLAVVEVTGNTGRSYGQGKQVEVCQAHTFTCSPIPGDNIWAGPSHEPCPTRRCAPTPAAGSPGSAVSLDPAWSPDGNTLAYVKSPTSPTVGWPPLSWYQAHHLFIWNRNTNTSTPVADTAGISVSTWSAHGTRLLYVANDELWLWHRHRTPVAIASPLYPPIEWEEIATDSNISYYGQINWTAQFNWWTPK